MRFARRLCLVGYAVAAPVLAQQTTSPAQHVATIVGVAVDSIHGGILAGATILLDGTTRTAVTGKDGRFRFDSVPPGAYRIAMFHPLLDTLDIAVGTAQLRMGVDSVREVILATPSERTIVERSCPAAKRRLGPAAIMGRVEDPDTHAALANARVSVVWRDVAVGRASAIERTSAVRETTTDANGNYVLCGIARGIRGSIQAEHAGSKTAEVTIELGDTRLALLTLGLPSMAAEDSAPTIGRAVLSGRVVDQSGSFVADAHVVVQGSRAEATTAVNGAFRMTDLPSGTRAVSVRRIGYTPTEVAVNLSAATPATVVVHLEKTGSMLAPVKVVTAYDSALTENGFTERKRMGMGRYMTGAQIASRHPQVLSDLFRTIPGFEVKLGVTGNAIRSTRSSNGCISFWIDNVQQREGQPGDMDVYVHPEQIMALETYTAADAPEQFKSTGATGCSVVVIWTNRTIR